MKLAICNELFEGWEIGDVFRCAADLGYDAVEIAPFTLCESVAELDQDVRERIRRQAEETGIAIAGLHWLLVSPKGLHISHPDAAIRRATQDYFFELVRFCGDIGGRVLVLGSPKERSSMAPHTLQDTREHSVALFRECAERAAEQDVIVCLEPLLSDMTDFINTPAEAVAILEQIDHPNLRLIIDVYSSFSEGLNIPENIRRYSQYLEHFHSNDSNGYCPGTGEADYPGIIEALQEILYEGYLSTEVFHFEPDPVTIARQSIEFLKRALDSTG